MPPALRTSLPACLQSLAVRFWAEEMNGSAWFPFAPVEILREALTSGILCHCLKGDWVFLERLFPDVANSPSSEMPHNAKKEKIISSYRSDFLRGREKGDIGTGRVIFQGKRFQKNICACMITKPTHKLYAWRCYENWFFPNTPLLFPLSLSPERLLYFCQMNNHVAVYFLFDIIHHTCIGLWG